MNIYLAYRFHGEDFDSLLHELSDITSALKESGHSVYHSVQYENYFRENNFSNKKILDYSLEHLDKSDALLAYIKSPEKSEGMLLEIGYAHAKGLPVFVAIKKGLKTGFVTEIAKQVIMFGTLEDLTHDLRKFRFQLIP